jgi:hypothetical protein
MMSKYCCEKQVQKQHTVTLQQQVIAMEEWNMRKVHSNALYAHIYRLPTSMSQ